MEPFKNLINAKVGKQTARAILRNYPQFQSKQFLSGLEADLEPLELKARVVHLAQLLHLHLPKDLTVSIPLLKSALKENENDKDGLSGFAVWPLTEYVARYGLSQFDLSMQTLKEMTKVFTAEFAVRTFFLADQKKTMRFFDKWVTDKNEHVRRLVSEGSRPLLPWGQKLPAFVEDPTVTIHLLEKLKGDSSMYVRKSVANHLNDHTKNHPDFVVNTLLDWKKKNPSSPEIHWVIKHASRTLIKKGHQNAFALHGVETKHVEILSQKILTKKIKLGEKLQVEVTVVNRADKKQKIILDHEIHLLKANATYNVKCFKGKVDELQGMETKKFHLSIPLKAVTTRKYYHGKHFWNAKLNGASGQRQAFILEVFEESFYE